MFVLEFKRWRFTPQKRSWLFFRVVACLPGMMGSDWPPGFAVCTSEWLSSVVGTLVFFFKFSGSHHLFIVFHSPLCIAFVLHQSGALHSAAAAAPDRVSWTWHQNTQRRYKHGRVHYVATAIWIIACLVIVVLFSRETPWHPTLSGFSFNSLHRLLLIITRLKMAF